MRKFSLIVLTALCSTTFAFPHEWRILGNLHMQRSNGNAAAISPTSALVVGGFPIIVLGSQYYGPWITRSSEIIDIARNEIRYTDSTSVPHADGPMVTMSNGHVVILGGLTDGKANMTTLVEEFDPVTEKWTTKGNLLFYRRQQLAIALDSHRIMIVTGRDATLHGTSIVEIFDLNTGICKRVQDHPHRLTHGDAALIDGKVYVIGGRESGPNSSHPKDVYYYDESSDAWIYAFDLPIQMMGGATVAANGGVYQTGGTVNLRDDEFSDAVYFINSQGAAKLPGRLQIPVKAPGFLHWTSDSILCYGGDDEGRHSVTVSSWLDASTNKITPGPPLNIGRVFGMHVALTGDAQTSSALLAIGGLLTENTTTPTVEILTRSACDASASKAILENPLLLTTVGSARSDVSNHAVVLTETDPFSAGAVWYRSKLAVSAGFSTSFSFRLSNGTDNDQPDGGHPGADGVALVIQNSSPAPLGRPGQGIGYEDIRNAVAIEFDAYLNASYSDPSESHIAVQSAKDEALKPWHRSPYLKGITNSIPSLKSDGTVYYARVECTDAGIDVYLDTKPEFTTPVLSIPDVKISDLIHLDTDGSAWLGITSATGFSVQKHELISWTLDGCQPLTTGVFDDEFVRTGHNGNANQALMPAITPMPSQNDALLRWSNANGAVDIFVYDVNGVQVWRLVAPATNIQMGVRLPAADLTTGLYHVKIVDRDSVHHVTWLVQH